MISGSRAVQKLALRVIETDSLVEPMKLRRSGIPVRQFREPVVGNLIDVAYRFDLPGIDHRAMQKSGLLIFMVINDFQQQDHFLSLIPGNGKQQPVTGGQFGPVIPGRRHFFDFRRNEIACFEKFDHPLELVLQLTRLQLIVTQYIHWFSSLSGIKEFQSSRATLMVPKHLSEFQLQSQKIRRRDDRQIVQARKVAGVPGDEVVGITIYSREKLNCIFEVGNIRIDGFIDDGRRQIDRPTDIAE